MDLSIALAQTPVQASAYSAKPGESVRTDTSNGPVTVTLPPAPPANTVIGIKQVATSGSNTTTVACSGSDAFNQTGGGTTLTLTLPGQGATVAYRSGVWLVVSGDLPLGQLDGRYAAGIDTTPGDIAALGVQAAGSTGKAADAGHVHPATGVVLTSSLPLAIASGGTGSGTQNFMDLTTNQAIAGIKTFSGEIIVPAPVSSGDAVTKAYADAIATGLQVKPAAVAATTGSETFTVSGGHVTQIAGTTLDTTVSPQIGDLILVKDAPASTGTGTARSSVTGNGLYSVTGNTTNLSVSRASAMSGANGPVGAFVFTTSGTVNAGAGYVVTTPASGGFTYDSGSIQWTQFSAAGTVSAGAGLTQSGTVISLTAPVAAASLPAATTGVQGAVILDGTGADIAALGIQAAGVSTKAAAADHVHPLKSWASLYAAPSGATAETYPRMMCTASQTPVSGRLQANSIVLPAGLLVTSLTFCTGTGAVATLAHGWYVLMDNTYKVLASTADRTSATWGSAATPVTLALSSPFTTTYTGQHYAGWMVTAGTVANTMATSANMNNGTVSAAPVLCGFNGSGFTTPPSNGTTLTLTGSGFWSLYAYTS